MDGDDDIPRIDRGVHGSPSARGTEMHPIPQREEDVAADIYDAFVK